MAEAVKVTKHACKQCGKKNARGRDLYCPTCKRIRKKASTVKSHDNMVQEKYGLKPGEYQALLDFQGGVCFICGGGAAAKRRLAVDHDHKTGRPRGLLCRNCNYVWLGRMLKEGVKTTIEETLTKLLTYYKNTLDYLQDPPYDRMVRDKTKEK